MSTFTAESACVGSGASSPQATTMGKLFFAPRGAKHTSWRLADYTVPLACVAAVEQASGSTHPVAVGLQRFSRSVGATAAVPTVVLWARSVPGMGVVGDVCVPLNRAPGGIVGRDGPVGTAVYRTAAGTGMWLEKCGMHWARPLPGSNSQVFFGIALLGNQLPSLSLGGPVHARGDEAASTAAPNALTAATANTSTSGATTLRDADSAGDLDGLARANGDDNRDSITQLPQGAEPAFRGEVAVSDPVRSDAAAFVSALRCEALDTLSSRAPMS